MVSTHQQLNDTASDSEPTLKALGARVRELRLERGFTLQDLSTITGLSPSMISLVERGRTSPSIGTLVAISSGLAVPMPDLFSGMPTTEDRHVSRLGSQPLIETEPGYSRRMVKVDRSNHVEFSVLTFSPGVSTHERASAHGGVEYGLVIEGELVVEVGTERHTLQAGDAVSYPSSESHRMINGSDATTVAVWVNIGVF